jgi:hypothetical protein
MLVLIKLLKRQLFGRRFSFRTANDVVGAAFCCVHPLCMAEVSNGRQFVGA